MQSLFVLAFSFVFVFGFVFVFDGGFKSIPLREMHMVGGCTLSIRCISF